MKRLLRFQEHCSDMIAQRLCLNAIAAFVDRVNVELVANDVFVALEIAMLDSKDISEVSFIEVLIEILLVFAILLL